MRVAVFCGSSAGREPRYATAAAGFGRGLAEAGVGVVYGGASVGLMGVLADAALAAGGEVIGVIPGGLFAAEVPHQGLTRLQVVASMHERKALMADLANAFAALPGGLGTLDELFEVLTWRQLGLHAKPVALVDVDGFWDPLAGMLDGLTEAEFVPAAARRSLARVADADEFLRLLG
jgi:uncharacterized protein (TIGR00730 family)